MLIREPQPEDLALVHDSFRRAVKDTVTATEGVPAEWLVAQLDRCLTDPRWHVAVLCPDDELPDEIGGWVVWRRNEVVWLAVKPRYQGLGFGKALLDHAGIAPGAVLAPLIPRGLCGAAARHGYRLIHRPFGWLL